MEMEFVKTVMGLSGIDTAYTLAKRVGCSTQLVDTWLGKVAGKFPEGMKLRFLCRLRLISGLSWNQLGKLLDEEFLSEEPGRKK